MRKAKGPETCDCRFYEEARYPRVVREILWRTPYRFTPIFSRMVLILRDYHDNAVRENWRLSRYIENILAFERFEGDKLVLYYEDIKDDFSRSSILDFIGIPHDYDLAELRDAAHVVRHQGIESAESRDSATGGDPPSDRPCDAPRASHGPLPAPIRRLIMGTSPASSTRSRSVMFVRSPVIGGTGRGARVARTRHMTTPPLSTSVLARIDRRHHADAAEAARTRRTAVVADRDHADITPADCIPFEPAPDHPRLTAPAVDLRRTRIAVEPAVTHGRRSVLDAHRSDVRRVRDQTQRCGGPERADSPPTTRGIGSPSPR